MSELLVAIDPGDVTGYAQYGWPDEEFASMQGPWQEMMRKLHQAVAWAHEWRLPMTVICESYIVTAATAKKSQNLSAPEGIGVARYLATSHGFEFVLQTPADAKRFSTDERLHRLGWRFPSKGGHRNDAARHLLLFMSRTGRLDLHRLVI